MAVRDDFSPGEVLTSSDLNDTFASKRANLTPYDSTSSNKTMANADMQEILAAVGAITITLPAEDVIDTNSVFWLWATNNTVTVSVPSGITVANTPSGSVTNSTFTISSGTVAAFYLYSSTTWLYSAGGGLTAANFSNTATGTYTDGSGVEWKYIDYTASSTLTIDRAGLVECLIVAGGGGGGGAPSSGSYGGGGGAGGLLGFGTFTNATTDALYLPAATYTVTVGSGGAGGTTAPTGGSFGTDSRLGDIYAHRGAPGQPGSSNNNLKGGSGGGGGGASGGSGIPGQGNNGAGLSAGQAGGGGGAGGAASGATAGAGLSIDMRGGSSYTYCTGGASTLTFTTREIGDGGDGYAGFNVAGQTGGNGRVVVRVRTN